MVLDGLRVSIKHSLCTFYYQTLIALAGSLYEIIPDLSIIFQFLSHFFAPGCVQIQGGGGEGWWQWSEGTESNQTGS